MPFQSEKQRRYMHANLPDIAKRWERDYAGGGIAELNQELNSLPEYYMPFPAAQGGLIPAHEAGIYGLAEGGRTGFFTGAQADTASGKSMSPGTSASGGTRNGGPGPDRHPDVPTPPKTTTVTGGVPHREDPIEKIVLDSKDPTYRPDYYQTKSRVGTGETWGERAEEGIKRGGGFLSFIKNAALAIIPGLLPAKMAMALKFGQGVLDYKAGKLDHFLPDNFKSTSEFATNIANTMQQNAEKRKTDKAEQDLINSLPRGHPERIQLERLKKDTPDDVHERDGAIQETGTSITIDAEEVNDAKTQLLRKYQEMNDASRLAWERQQQMNRAKQEAYYKMFRDTYVMAAQGGRVPAGYNTGGLSNLFKLKNV